MHSISTSPNTRYHTTVLNTDVQNCYTTLKVVCSKLSNDLNSTSKVKCGLFSRIISLYNSSVQNCQNLCSEWAPCTRKQALKTTTPQKTWSRIYSFTFSVASLHLQLHGNMSLYRGENALLSAIFRVEYFIPQTY